MALFNKFFLNRNYTNNNHKKKDTQQLQDFIGEKLFAFSKDQVRLVLFRECDFRGRKLLFDSSCVKKVPITTNVAQQEKEKFAEISNGYGYIYTKPKGDRNQLSEMVFGSVAMSFRGTYFKMHTLETPNRLMFTQVFPSPRHSGRISVSSQNYEHSTNKFNDSGASSCNSMNSTTSDTILVCRNIHNNTSTALDISNTVALSSSNPNSTVEDSGYCAENSFSNFSSEPPSLGTSNTSLSATSLYKKWIRKTSTSLDNSGVFSSRSSGSGDEDSTKLHQYRSTKIGFALIIELTAGQEDALCHFLMEHVVLIETILWRIRRAIEIAFVKLQDFVSLMVDITNLTTQYLVCLLSGSYLSINFWLLLSNGCDSYNSISAFSAAISNSSSLLSSSTWWSSSLNSSFTATTTTSANEFYPPRRRCNTGLNWKHTESNSTMLNNLGKFLKSDWGGDHPSSDSSNNRRNILQHEQQQQRDLTAEKFIQDFCELLETIDVKDTNFFMSTLLTAVLTHHLGWVNTCLPPCSSDTESPFNPLWGELSDLYGALGHPMKMSQTILTGGTNRRRDVLTKIQTSLTYFIRCCDVIRRIPDRTDTDEENHIANRICQQYSCIPKENYKRYEDHLREIMNNNSEFFNSNNKDSNQSPTNFEYIEMKTFPIREKKITKRSKGLTKTQTCIQNLAEMLEEQQEKESDFHFHPHSSSTSSSSSSKLYKSKTNTLYKVSSVNGTLHSKSSTIKLNTCDNVVTEMEQQQLSSNDVVFVLGENEQLVGLKKSHSIILENRENIPPKRPTYLNLTKQFHNCDETGGFHDADFIKNDNSNLIKPSTSWSSLHLSDNVKTLSDHDEEIIEDTTVHCNSRSQSVPPEERKFDADTERKTAKSKYRYSGVKFNLQQYPQILSNYMKSKNLEISNLQFGEKGLKIDELSSISDVISSKYPEIDIDYEEGEALQTPSNASELEFTSDIFIAPSSVKECAKETTNVENLNKPSFVKQYVPNTIIVKESGECDKKYGTIDVGNNRKISGGWASKMRVANFPMPKCNYTEYTQQPINYTSSLFKAANDKYMPDMVMQTIITPKSEWESNLKSDLALASQHSPIDQPLDEAVAIIGNIDTWEVQLMSSHTFVIDKGSTGVRVGMSQLVANMLESLLQMWKLNVPSYYCLLHIEQTLQEFCIRSKALAELLLATEFCNMEQVTSMLHLEVNDVPLLLAVASTHSPQVTQKYGLSFQ